MELRILIISSEEEVNKELKHRLGLEAGNLKDGNLKIKVFEKLPSVEEALVHFAPHLIILHFARETWEDANAFLDQISRIADRVPIIVSAAELEADFMLSCIKRGVRDFIKHPIDQTEVAALLKKLHHERPKNIQEKQVGQTYTFFSYKGGIGTTFLSCNTAVALSQVTGGRVLIWDLVFQNGDVPFFFDYDPVATLTDLLENLSRIDAQYLEGVLPVHSSGVSILAAPKRPEDAEGIRSDQIQQLHQLLIKYYDYIVIDAGHTLTDPVISVMDNSKYILMTTDLHLPVLKNTLKCLEVFERLGYVEGKFKILLNRYNSKYERFDLQKAEEILRYSISFSITNDYITASRSVNAGIPVAELDKESVLAKQFEQLSELLTNDFIVKQRRPSLMSRLFKGRSGRRKQDAATPSEPAEKKEKEEENAA